MLQIFFFFFFTSFLGILTTRLRQNLLMRKSVVKSVYILFPFIKQILLIRSNLFFSFDIFLLFIGISFRTTQNIMFRALKVKPLSSILSQLLRRKNNEGWEYKRCHRSLTPDHFTICESSFKFLGTVSLATDSSTTFFHFYYLN